MKKFYYLCLAAGLTTLASCSSDDFLGGKTASTEKSSNVIGFGTNAPSFTRDLFEHGSAAQKLNNNFIVYGFKTTFETSQTSDLANASTDMMVFDHYNVNYVEGSARTTESNTAGWEYVGLWPHESSSSIETAQSIKYWDYSTDQYVFSAVSGTGITAKKATSALGGQSAMKYNDGVMELTTAATEYDKGWEVTIPQGGSLSDLYASNRVVAKKTGATSPELNYQDDVKLTFYNMGARVRFAMYETVPGYSIQIKKFYHDIGGTPVENTTNFDIDGNFTTLGTGAGGTKLLVTYYPDGTLKNRPKVTPSTGAVQSAHGEFGTNIQPTTAIGTSSSNPTYDQSDKSYTDIIPSNGGALNLKVDYTLTSTDGSHETINVYGATATVPENFTEWKANFAYTYVFKISDNTNGTTEEGGSVEGLYPITFDAVVIGNEDGIQETITSVSNPSITTYQKGEVVTANNEYVAGAGMDIYFEDDNRDISGYHVYEVNNLTPNLFETQSNMTEEVVANYFRNFCVLTEVTVTPSTGAQPTNFIPLSDGTYIKKTANQAGMFTPAAGKTYVIANDVANVATLWKVVKVQGTPAAVAYTQAITTTIVPPATNPQITATAGTITYKLTSNSPADDANVLGATPCIKIYKSGNDVTSDFNIADNTDGTYTITLTNDAIAAGANGTYTIKFNNVDCTQDFDVALDYALSPASITVIAGNATGTNTVLNVNSTATDGKVVNTDNKIKVENTATGTYKVTASADAAAGGHTLTIGGQTLTVTVNTYSFSADVLTITRKASGDATGNITINENSSAKTGLSLTTSPALAPGTSMTDETDGVYTYTVTPASAGGTYNISYENAKAQVIVNAYTLTAANANIAKNTGSTVLTLTKDNGTVTTENASAAKVTVKKNGTTVTTGFKLTANGKTLTFGNVSASGVYTFEYSVGSDVVAIATVVVGTDALTASATNITSPSGTSILTYEVDDVATPGVTPSVNTGVSGTDWSIADNGNGTYTFTGMVAGTYNVTIGTKTVTITVS